MKRYEVTMEGTHWNWNARFEVFACNAERAAEIVRGITLYDRDESAVMSIDIFEEMEDAEDKEA